MQKFLKPKIPKASNTKVVAPSSRPHFDSTAPIQTSAADQLVADNVHTLKRDNDRLYEANRRIIDENERLKVQIK